MDAETIARRADSVFRGATRLAVLFGSQVTARIHAESDIDIAILPLEGADPDEIAGRIMTALGTDRVDLVDLRRASGLLQHIVATRGRLLWQESAGVFAEFASRAERRWEDERRRMPFGWRALQVWLRSRRRA